MQAERIKKIVPCLDIRDGRVVKGKNFEGIQDVSDPVELATFYSSEGADELVFYDITASTENRSLFTDLLKRVMESITVPLTVGGGIRTVEDVERVLDCGAQKVSINSGAIANPNLIREVADRFGSQCVVFSMDVKKVAGQYRVFSGAGRQDTGIDAVEWAKQGEQNGAGELVVNSIDTDGVKGGFDLELLRLISDAVSVSIVASGGAGSAEDFVELFRQLPQIDTGLAASVFHNKEVRIPELKVRLSEAGIPVNMGAKAKE